MTQHRPNRIDFTEDECLQNVERAIDAVRRLVERDRLKDEEELPENPSRAAPPEDEAEPRFYFAAAARHAEPHEREKLPSARPRTLAEVDDAEDDNRPARRRRPLLWTTTAVSAAALMTAALFVPSLQPSLGTHGWTASWAAPVSAVSAVLGGSKRALDAAVVPMSAPAGSEIPAVRSTGSVVLAQATGSPEPELLSATPDFEPITSPFEQPAGFLERQETGLGTSLDSLSDIPAATGVAESVAAEPLEEPAQGTATPSEAVAEPSPPAAEPQTQPVPVTVEMPALPIEPVLPVASTPAPAAPEPAAREAAMPPDPAAEASTARALVEPAPEVEPEPAAPVREIASTEPPVVEEPAAPPAIALPLPVTAVPSMAAAERLAEMAEALAAERKAALERERERADALARELAHVREELGSLKTATVPSWIALPAPPLLLGPSLPPEPPSNGQAGVPEPTETGTATVQAAPAAGSAPARTPVPSIAEPAPREAAAPSAPSSRPIGPSKLPIAEEKRMMERAIALLQNRDVSAARLVLERGVGLGSSRAAFVLAQTYDPKMLEEWEIIGVQGDAKRAFDLYSRAYESGVADAEARIREMQASVR
jgi:hypothetical protein